MKNVIIIIFSIISLLLIVVFMFDYVLKIHHNLSRFHIGRWSNRQEWSEAVERKAARWLKHTPTVPLTDNFRYVLIDILCGKYRSPVVQSWQSAGLLLGLSNSSNSAVRCIAHNWAKSQLDINGMWKKPVHKVDFAMLSYAVLKLAENPNHVRPAMDWTAQMLKENLCDDGMISYSQGRDSSIRFVDTLGMVCPFLSLYGTVYQKEEFLQLAVHQLKEFRKVGLLHDSSLPCHAIDMASNLPLGIYGWGRGTAWYATALLDTYSELPDTCRGELKTWIDAAAQEYEHYQQSDGGFFTIMQGGGQYDSSVTAVMAYFYASCSTILHDPHYKDIADRCLDRLMLSTMKDGAVDLCQGDTHGIGCFSQTFDIMPFAQGAVLRAISEMRRI